MVLVMVVACAAAYNWWDYAQATKAHVACKDSLFIRMNLYDGIWNTYLDDKITVVDAAKNDEENPTIATWDDMGQSLFTLTSNLARNGEKLDSLKPLSCLANIGDKTLRSWDGWGNVNSGDMVKIAHDMQDAHEALVALIEASVECYMNILVGMESLDTGEGIAASPACKASEAAADTIPLISENIAQFTRLLAR